MHRVKLFLELQALFCFRDFFKVNIYVMFCGGNQLRIEHVLLVPC